MRLDVRLDARQHLLLSGRAPVIVVYAATAIGGSLCIDDESLETAEFEPGTFRGTTSRSRAPKKAARLSKRPQTPIRQ